MTHHLKILISYILLTSMSIVLLFNQFPLISHAEVPQSQKVVGHSTTFGSLDWDYTFHNKYFTIQDSTGIPTDPLLKPYYFYTKDNVTFWAINGKDLISAVLTAGIGIITSEQDTLAFIQAFLAEINLSKDANTNTFIQGALYDSNNNLLGYCLNDIHGCYYQGIDIVENVTIPSETVNNVYNYYNTTLITDIPDYLTFKGTTWDYVHDIWGIVPQQTEQRFTELYNIGDEFNVVADVFYKFNTTDKEITQIFESNSYGNTLKAFDNNMGYWLCTNNSSWQDFCLRTHKNSTDTDVDIDDLTNSYISSAFSIPINLYNNGNIVTGYKKISWVASPRETDTTVLGNQTGVAAYASFNLGFNSPSNNVSTLYYPIGDKFTVYKSQSIYNDIVVNQTYRPSTYYTNKYYNYNTNNDNSVTITTQTINNSVTNTTTIYDDCGNTFIENIDNSVIDNSVNIGDYEEIIEIYYPTPNDPDDPTDPDNPSNPDDPLDPDNPSGILDAILDALARFFKAIGKILATILAGILEVVDSVLEAIASIAENFTGVTEFITALLSWLPDPVPQVLGAALSVAILFALLSFIRG